MAGLIGRCGKNVFYQFNCESGELIISGSGKMFDYSIFSEHGRRSPFQQVELIKSVVVEEGIEHIGTQAFAECRNLEKVSICSTVKTISLYAFEACPRLKTVCYSGSEEDFDKIKILAGNTALENACFAERQNA